MLPTSTWILAGLFLLSEALGQIKAIQANNVFQLVRAALRFMVFRGR